MEVEEKELNFNDDLADYVNKEFKRRQSERTPFELQWRLTIEFIKGNQFLSMNPLLRKIEEVPKMYWWQEREVFNQIATITETRIARLTRQKPMMKVRPSSTDEHDFQTAKISSAILTQKWHDEKMDKKYNELVTWMEYTGTVLLKNTWDSEKGRKIATVMTQDIVEDEGFEIPVEKPVDIYEGDLESSVVSPFEFYPDSISRNDLEQCKSVIHARAFHVNDIEDMYGIEVNEEHVDVNTLQSSGGLSGATYKAGGFKPQSSKLKGHAILKEFYERPSKKHPNGRLIVVAGDQTLYSGELPYAIGDDGKRDFPFVKMTSVKIPNSFFGQCVAERCIPIQRRYNALRNRKAEYLNMVAIGQWYEPNGSLDDETELNNSPGNIIRYNGGSGKPEPVSYPSLPSSFETEEGSLLSEFTAVSGVSELSRFSEAPTGVKSGVALSIANEQDDTRIGMTASHISEGIKGTGTQWLRIYKQFAQEPRIVKEVGANANIIEWNGSDLDSDDVIIENSSALAETPAQRRQMVFDLMNTGLFNRAEQNPFGRESVNKILELIEIGHWETGLDDEIKLHQEKAQRENRMMQQGQQVPIQSFDDHEIHIKEHNKFRLRPEYEELIMTPEGQMIAQMIDQHVQVHQQALMEMQMRQQQMMQQQQLPQE